MVMGTRTPTPAQFTHADMNRDGRLNAADILLLQKQLLQAWLGIKGTTAVAGADLDLKYKQASRPTDMAAMTADWLQSLVPAAQAVQANQGVLYYVHNDPLGTPQVLTDEAGMVVWRARYDPFGKAVVDEDPDGDGNSVTFNVRFPGQYYDQETGLHYNYFRYYNPSTGRYITSDPIGIVGGEDLNPFAYVSNKPMNWIDPEGLKKLRGRGGDPRLAGSTNGPFGPICGSGSSAAWIPDRPWQRACEFHDACYATCGADKEVCDLTFLLMGGNLFYYGAISMFGGGPYEEAQEKACKQGGCN